MSHPVYPGRSPRGQRGFTIIETVMSTALLGILVLSALGGLLFGMVQARGSQNRAAAATWIEAELSFLLLQNGPCTSTCNSPLAVGTYTMTQSSTPRTWCGASGGSCPNGAVTEPPLPFGFDHASITVVAVSTPSPCPCYQVALQVTITLFQTPSTAFTTLSTYVSSFTKAGP